MKKVLIVLSLILALALILPACSSSTATTTAPSITSAPKTTSAPAPAPATAAPAPAPASSVQSPAAKSIVLSYSTPGAATAYQSVVVVNALNEITQRTNGQVTFKYFWGGALHAAGAVYDGVVSRGADMGYDQPSNSKGRFPVIETIEQPWGYPNAIVANQIAWDALKKFQPAELKDVHLFVDACFGHPVIISNKPIRTLSDMKGLKIRGTGNMASMIEALGAAAVSMPIFEVYDSLRKGTVDGAMVGPENLYPCINLLK